MDLLFVSKNNERINSIAEDLRLFLAKMERPDRIIVSDSMMTTTKRMKHEEGEGEDNVFDFSKYFDQLRTGRFGKHIIYAPSMPSTQLLMTESLSRFQPNVNDLICLTDRQTAGKGRGGNSWVSPLGCLMFSFSSTFRDGRTLPFVQYLGCLAVVRGIRSLPGCHELSIRIKWPNDIVTVMDSTKQNSIVKLGGLLCQSTFADGHFIVTTGIGLNVNNSEPTICLNQLMHENSITREAVLASIMNCYENIYSEFHRTSSFEPFLDEYLSYWLHSGQKVMVDLSRTHQTAASSSLSSSSTKQEVEIRGISLETGALLAVNPEEPTQMLELHPDGNSFDFFQGLITRKL